MVKSAVILVAVLASVATAAPPAVTTVCAVAGDMNRFAERPLTIHAAVKAGGHYDMMLYDASCQAGIILDIPDRLAKAPDVDHLRSLVFANYPESRGRLQAVGTFTGILHVSNGKARIRNLRVSAVSAVGPYAR